MKRSRYGALFGCSAGREQQCQRVDNPDGRNHRKGQCKLPIAPHAARSNQLRKTQVGDHVRRQERHQGEDRRRAEAWPQHEQQHARGAKRVQEGHHQPLPDVSTVRECANQGRESYEDRVNHSEHLTCLIF